MLYLVLAVLSSAMVSITMRFSEGRSEGSVFKLSANYFMCLLLALMYTGGGGLFPDEEGLGTALLLGGLCGMLYLASFLTLQLSVRRNGVVLSGTFMKLGLLVPLAVSAVFFNEMPTLPQLAGCVLAIGAIVFMNMERERTVMGSMPLLILLLLGGGASDAATKVFEELGNPALREQFLLYIFMAALLLSVLSAIVKRERPRLGELGYGLLIGVPNYYSARFVLLAIGELPAVIVYPSYSVATIVAISLAGRLLFRERLGRRQKAAICVILAALVLLNV